MTVTSHPELAGEKWSVCRFCGKSLDNGLCYINADVLCMLMCLGFCMFPKRIWAAKIKSLVTITGDSLRGTNAAERPARSQNFSNSENFQSIQVQYTLYALPRLRNFLSIPRTRYSIKTLSLSRWRPLRARECNREPPPLARMRMSRDAWRAKCASVLWSRDLPGSYHRRRSTFSKE